jgi:hypothetical protein
VLTLLSTAVLAVRGAMQERRERAEQAFHAALACAVRPGLGRTEELRQCSNAARAAAESSLELPEHSSRQLEMRAALDELVSALESGNGHRLARAIERASRAGSALGWQVVHTRLH